VLDSSYSETGGLRCGQSFSLAANYSWPFAHILVTTTGITIRSSIGPFFARKLHFDRHQILSISKMDGMWSIGIHIEHDIPEYPAFVLFCTFRFAILKANLQALGYEMNEKK
jgi:hypothetical protein